ncbi:putative A/G-specific adenine glycosylase YfhQ [compost metagenome]
MSTNVSDSLTPEAFSTPLLQWFRAEQRAMPWRGARDPYFIWVSEVMLQQTQVATVIPYYERFMARFPTIQALAEAPLDDLLKHWEGLGYYSRARNLQKAAQQVVSEHEGRFPRDYAAIRALSGIGDYTAGAIASIAYNEPRPAVDGNVLRVLSRWFRIAEDVTKPQAKRIFEELAVRLIPEGHAWEFNQALMELGALICSPRRPRCAACPVAEACRAHLVGDVDAYPVKTKKAPPRPVRFAVAVLARGESVWIVRRPAEGLLGGLWEFPALPMDEDGDAAALLEAGLKLRRLNWAPLCTVQHTYTHMKATMQVLRAELPDGHDLAPDDDRRWVPVEDLGSYAFSNANQKIISALDLGPLFRLPKA